MFAPSQGTGGVKKDLGIGWAKGEGSVGPIRGLQNYRIKVCGRGGFVARKFPRFH